MKYVFTAEQIKKMGEATSKCYYEARVEVLSKRGLSKQGMVGLTLFLSHEERVATDELYRIKVCTLDTYMLEDIVRAHYSGDVRRTEITLDAIRNELAARALLNL